MTLSNLPKAQAELLAALPKMQPSKEQFIQTLQRDLLLSLNDGEAATIIEKNARGRYDIMTVSTAAIEDREGETFTVEAIDYDIAEAERTGEYPEIRAFHSKQLGIGQIHKMMRVGIFAVDFGESYDDPFSLSVCKKMLADNDGKWRVSRGFRVLELSGACPECESVLSISTKHMLSGFRCPSCETVHLRFKGALGGIRFMKARTFDVTITDVPAVPWTGAFAWRKEDNSVVEGDLSMTKKELKERLMKAGIPEDAVDTRLKEISDADLLNLGDMTDIPNAEILKEWNSDPATDPQEGTVVEFDDMVDAFKQVVRKEIEEALNGFQVEIDGIEFPEYKQDTTGITAIKEAILDLNVKVDALMEKDEARLKDMLSTTSRSSKLRILRMKEKEIEDDEDEEDEEDEDKEDMEKEFGLAAGTLDWIKGFDSKKKSPETIVDSTGQEFGSLTAMVHGNPVKK